MATTSSGARRVIRPQADVTGDNVLAELQAKLKVRRGSSELNPHYQAPPSGGHKKLGGIGKSTSLVEKPLVNFGTTNSTSVGEGQVTTKWHLQFSSTPTNDQATTTTTPIAIPGSGHNNNSSFASSNGRPTRPRALSKSLPKQSFGRIGPPPKIPPPQFDKSSHSTSDKPQRGRPEDSRSPPPPLNTIREKSAPLAKSPTAGGLNSNIRPLPDASKSPPPSSKEQTPPRSKPKKKTSIEKLSSSAGEAKKELKRLFGRNKGRVSSEPKDLFHQTSNDGVSRLDSEPSISDPVFIPPPAGMREYANVFEDEAFARFDRRRRMGESPEGTPSPNSSRTGKKPIPLPRKNSIGSSAVHNTGMSDGLFRFSESESYTNQIQAATKLSTSSEEEDYVESFNELESEIDRLADIAKLPPLSLSVPNKSPDSHVTSFERKKQQLCKTMSHNPAANVPIERRTTPQERKELRHGICSEGAQMTASEDDDDEYIAMNSISMSDLTSSTLELPTSDYPLDPRASGYYLKILPSHGSKHSGNRVKPAKPVSYAEFRRQNPLPARGVNETSLSSPSKQFVESADSESESESDPKHQPIHLKRQTKITSSEMSPRQHQPVNKRTSNSVSGAQRFKVSNSKPKNGRTVQYSDVTVDTSGSSVKRKPSMPKRYRYQMVNLNKESKPVLATGGVDQPLPALPRRSTRVDTNEIASKTTIKSNSNDPERIYYTTSSSLASQTGLTRPPPLSGSVPGARAVWHEYVEIDEEEIADKKPSNQVTLPVPAEPEKKTSNVEESSIPPRASSTSSTDSQPYKMKPPGIPYRPDDLDKFVEHRCVSSGSGDYSYAAVPGLNLFGLQWFQFHAQHFPNIPLPMASQLSQSVPTTKTEVVKTSQSHSVKDKQAACPPTIPPKTLSLLREQGLVKDDNGDQIMGHVPQPYLNFVPQTSGKKRSASEAPLASNFGKKDKSSSQGVSLPVATFTSYVFDPNVTPQGPPGDKQHSPPFKPVTFKSIPPPKPQPYKPVNIRKPIEPSNLQSSKSGTKLSSASMSARELTCSDVKTRELTRTKAHRKLSRQRSYSAGQMSASMKRKASTRHKKQIASTVSVAMETSNPKVSSEGDESVPALPQKDELVVRRRAKQPTAQGTAGGVDRKIDRRSLAVILQNKDTISKHLSKVYDIGTLQRNHQPSPKPLKEDESEKVRDLGEILLEVDMLLRKKVCTQNDLLSAIESQLNIKLHTVRATGEQTGMETSREVEKLECDSTVEITDKEVEQVVKYVNDNRVESLESEMTSSHTYENQTYDVMMQTQSGMGINHPYQNQVYGMKNGNETETQQQASETDGYENVKDWTTSNATSLISLPESKPRSRTFVEVNVDEIEKQAMLESHDPTSHYMVPRVRSKSNVTFSPTHQLSRPRLPTLPSHRAQPSSAQLQVNEGAPAITVTSTNSHGANQLQLLHNNTSFDENISPPNATSPNYKLALQMEEDRVKTSSHDVLQASDTSTTVDGVQTTQGSINEETRDSRSNSFGQRPLRRVNARRRSSASNTTDITTNTSFTNGVGVFTSRGGKLTNTGSGIEVEIPENAIPKGKKQKIWFDVLQTVMDPSNEEDMLNSLSDSGNFEMESYLIEKQDRRVQLSPMVLVGPCDAMLNRPIKIKLPHCLPYRNNSWHLQLQARGQNCESESWSELTNSFGLVEPPAKRGKNKFYKKSCYQMHMEYVQVQTSQLGCFKLMGTPIRNGTHTAKKMVTSVFTKTSPDSTDSTIQQLDVFITNAIQDQVQALETALSGSGFVCVERNIPVLLFGDGRDMELMLSTENNSATPLGTKVIPFGEFWRQKKVGQSHVTFNVDKNMLAKDPSRTLTLRMQQAGAKFVHETNFVVS